MSSLHPHSSRRVHGFTLVELMIAISVVIILATLIVSYTQQAMDKARQTKCAGQMRQIFVGISAFIADNGRYYTVEEVGNSAYRGAKDKLGLPDLLDRGNYLSKGPVWLSPGARPEQVKYGNTYAWSKNSNIAGKPLGTVDNPRSHLLLFNAYAYTLPSVSGVPEGGSSGGPRPAPNAYWYYSFEDNTAVNFLYADGHVELMVLKKPKNESSSSGSGGSTSGSGSTTAGSQSGEKVTDNETGTGSGSSTGGSTSGGSPIDAKPTNSL